MSFPTANLHPCILKIDYGVYACKVKINEGLFAGALKYGDSPTFNLTDSICEIYLLDFSGDLYGQKVQVTVYNKIREVKKFENADKLKVRIMKDVLAVRKFFNSKQ